jgi:hypothetical protein
MKMLKIFLIILFFSFSFLVKGQAYNELDDCGIWKISRIYNIEWTTIDTIDYCAKCDNIWVYSEWENENLNEGSLVWCPCGCGWDTKRYMDRINNQGIKQRMWEITEHEYTSKPETPYEQKLDSINKRKPISYTISGYIRIDGNDTLVSYNMCDTIRTINEKDEQSIDTTLCIEEVVDNYGNTKDLGLLKEYIELKTIKLLKNLWSDYKNKCRNDTTWVSKDIIDVVKNIDPTFTMRYTQYKVEEEIVWFYKTPLYDEFMEYLQK